MIMRTYFFAGLLVLVLNAFSASGAPRETQWDQVKDAVKKGLPKTAIERLEPIITGALAEKAYPEALNAIGHKIALQATLQGNKPEEKIFLLEAELEKAPAAMRPILEALTAHAYWDYYQRNRWRFLQRTTTAEAPGADLRTWDLARILSQIDRHFTTALADDFTLKATPIGEYSDLLQPGIAPDNYRPTLFDFLAYEALSYYQAGEQGPVIAENGFEAKASTTPILADAVTFTSWQPVTEDTSSPKIKAIRLYQALLRFHEADPDQSAYLDADLARLTFAVNIAVGDERSEQYKSALGRLIEANAHHEIFARVCAALALKLKSEDNEIEAHQVAQRGFNAFPETVGGSRCFNLLQQIELKSASIETEEVWNAPWPTLNVTYRNVARVYFRAVAVNFEEELAASQWSNGDGTRNERLRLLDASPALEWSSELPSTPDYQPRTERLPVPTELKPGAYVILASHTPAFSYANNVVSATGVWISELALVTRDRTDGGPRSGFVLQAKTGAPVSGAVIRIWLQNHDGWPKLDQTTTSDQNGQFSFSNRGGAATIVAEAKGQMISSRQPLFSHTRESSKPGLQTVLFTDRSIYRPGQTIHYKGVSIQYDQNAGKYAALANNTVTLVFKDPSGQEIARARHRTNDYGSFDGVFIAPRDRLMGAMTLSVDGRALGYASIQVEEYKRPKFRAEIQPPVESAKLDQQVVVKGKATAYTGAAIDGAKVTWRVERAVLLPSWCWWWRPPATEAIAHGTSVTDAEGSFNLQFQATPDRRVPAKNEPVFAFKIHADITDSSGETRSDDRTVQIGFTALQASLAADDWQTPLQPVAIKVTTESLDGDGQSAEGMIQVFALKQPAKIARGSLRDEDRFRWNSVAQEPEVDPTNPDSWELGDLVAAQPVKTDAMGKAGLTLPLNAGVYRATFETRDRFGQKVTARRTLQVVDPNKTRYGVKLPDYFAVKNPTVEAGETFTALWGTGYDTGRAFVELECQGKILKSYWTASDQTQAAIELPITEPLRGGFTVRVTSVRENRAYLNERLIEVPWSNRKLTLKWQRFRSKLTPGQKETWTAVVTGPNAKPAAAEMVATLYDASLDQFTPHDWPEAFEVFRQERNRSRTVFQNGRRSFDQLLGNWQPETRVDRWTYRSFPPHVLNHAWGWQYTTVAEPAQPETTVFDGEDVILLSPFMINADQENGYAASSTLAGTRLRTDLADVGSAISVDTFQYTDGKADHSRAEDTAQSRPSGGPDLRTINARKNLNETAFFFPRLLSNRNGEVKLEFTVPEALTEWTFFGFAHDRQLRSGYLKDKVVTAKELMVQPNPPRFLRERDIVEFSVKVSNQSDQPQHGTVRLTFADAASLKDVDEALGNRMPDQSFELPAKESRSYAWRIAVPEGLGFLTYKAVAATAHFSDGEEGFLPVLSNQILVTESLPLPIRGKSTKQFEFKKLLASGSSDTLRHQSLTVQMTSQPAWYAVMALPYLMEFPYECSEQVFNRLYANALARHIAKSDLKIRHVFDLWKNSTALESPLEKNLEVKALALEETPWIRQAKAESETRKNLGVLFDQNRLEQETNQTLHKLSSQQLSDGLWPWFPGGRGSEYISLYIMTGFGRLQHLGVQIDPAPAIKSLAAIDAGMSRNYEEIRRGGDSRSHEYVPSALDALYLYGRSFFLKDFPITARDQLAIDFYLKQSRKLWLKVDSRQGQAHLALALHRFGDHETALAIMRSIKERSVHDDELGMFWRETELSWWWYRAPIETQAVMIEAFAEVSNDVTAVEDCKVWLLKQKQTQDWKTTKATADAIYALLLQGENLLASDAIVEVALAGKTIRPEKTEAGTGFYEQTFSVGQINPDQGNITVKKADTGVSWGSVHWQYLEDMTKVTPHEGTPLKLKKTLFVKETTSQGPVLKPLTGSLSVGDEVVVRIEHRTDRDMEYVHLKDHRGSGTEPVNVLSGYRYRDGLAYYEMTRDTATHDFIDYLPKGVYVFEYSTRVQLKGRYQTGIAEAQCMYAPEFNSHSESTLLEVR